MKAFHAHSNYDIYIFIYNIYNIFCFKSDFSRAVISENCLYELKMSIWNTCNGYSRSLLLLRWLLRIWGLHRYFFLCMVRDAPSQGHLVGEGDHLLVRGALLAGSGCLLRDGVYFLVGGFVPPGPGGPAKEEVKAVKLTRIYLWSVDKKNLFII